LSITKTKNPVYSWVRSRARIVLGKLFNLAGIPGLIQDCDYEAGITDATIKVRVRDLFTIIEVNGLEIYFHRLTGSIDGVGSMPCCTQDAAPQLAPAHEPSETVLPALARTQSEWDRS
jgi:hypothetical protein